MTWLSAALLLLLAGDTQAKPSRVVQPPDERHATINTAYNFQSINAVTFATNNMASSSDFYQKLGFNCTYGGPAASFSTFGSAGGPGGGDNSFHINVFLSKDYRPPASGHWNGWGRAIFYVDNVDAAYQHALSQSLRPEAAPANASWGERYFQILDPMGHEISFAKPLARTDEAQRGVMHGGIPSATDASSANVSETMCAFQASGVPCSAPDWPCLTLASKTPLPVIGHSQVLLRVMGSSVNPLDVKLVQPSCKLFPPGVPFHCSNGTLGFEGTGVVAVVGTSAACAHFNVGSEVWGFFGAAYAEFAVAECRTLGLKPRLLKFVDAGTIPVVGATSLQSLRMAGAPWTEASNLTLAITSGQGGTGFLAVQLAKVLGAKRVITAASGPGLQMVRSLGADVVVDYRSQELFDALPDDSVDIVYDNFGKPGTADRAMRTIRNGGLFLLLTGELNGDLSKHPKAGVRQARFNQMNSSDDQAGIDALARLFDAGALKPYTFHSYNLADVPKAFTKLLAGGVFGKIAITPGGSGCDHGLQSPSQQDASFYV